MHYWEQLQTHRQLTAYLKGFLKQITLAFSYACVQNISDYIMNFSSDVFQVLVDPEDKT